MDEPFVHKVFMKSGDVTDEQIWLGKNGLSKDEKADQEKAVFTYPIKHYTYWKESLADDSIDMGAVGENFSVLEMDEFTVCIGDTYQFGDAIIQVSQPGSPSLKSVDDFRVLAQNNGRTGWFFRVVEEGHIISRIDLELLERPFPEWTIAACNEIMHIYKDDLRMADELASCTLLSTHWRRLLIRRLRGI